MISHPRFEFLEHCNNLDELIEREGLGACVMVCTILL